MDEIEKVLDAAPDMSDCAIVIVNVETRGGEQYAFSLYPERDERMSVTYEHGERGRQTHQGDVLPRVDVHTFGVQVEEAL